MSFTKDISQVILANRRLRINVGSLSSQFKEQGTLGYGSLKKVGKTLGKYTVKLKVQKYIIYSIHTQSREKVR